MQISDAEYVHSFTVGEHSAPVASAELRMWASLGKKKKKRTTVCRQGYKSRKAPTTLPRVISQCFSDISQCSRTIGPVLKRIAGAQSYWEKPETFVQYLTQMFHPNQDIKQGDALCRFSWSKDMRRVLRSWRVQTVDASSDGLELWIILPLQEKPETVNGKYRG